MTTTDDGSEPISAREASRRSMAAIGAKDRQGWLALFADDAVVEDPIGPSMFDPTGEGHHGKEAIARFYDTVIAPNDDLRFDIAVSHLCGDEVANVGTINITLPGGTHVASVDGVFTYRVGPDGKIRALRAYWEQDRIEVREAGAPG